MIRVYINNSEIDVSQDSLDGFAATYSIADIESVQDRRSGSTQGIKALLTKRTKQALSFPDEINSVLPNIELAVTMDEDGATIFTGFAYVINSTKSMLENGYVELDLLGDGAEWQQRIAAKNMMDLDMSAHDHDFTAVNQVNSETGGSPYVYDIADRGLAYFGNVSDKMSIFDRYPALNISYLFEKILNDVGYKLQSTFCASTLFTKIYSPFVNQTLQNSEDYRILKRARMSRKTSTQILSGLGLADGRLLFNTADVSGSGVSPYNGYPFSATHIDTANGFYNVPVDMITKFRVQLKLNWTYGGGGTSQFWIYVINVKGSGVDGTPYDGVPIKINGNDFIEYTKLPTGDEYFTFETDWVQIGAGSKVCVKINQGLNMRTLGTSRMEIGSYIQNEIDPQVCSGQPIKWADNLPNLNQMEFIRGVKHLFNLYFVTDNINRIVYVEPRDSTYKSTYYDWSALIDQSQPMVIEELGKNYTKTVRLGFVPDSSDALMGDINTGPVTPYMDKDVSMTHYAAKDGITEMLNPVFSATFMSNYRRAGILTAKVPRMWKEHKVGEISERSSADAFIRNIST